MFTLISNYFKKSQIGFIVLTNGDWNQNGFTVAVTQIENMLLDLFDPQSISENSSLGQNNTFKQKDRKTIETALENCVRPWFAN